MAKSKKSNKVKKAAKSTFTKIVSLFITQIITVIVLFLINTFLFPTFGSTFLSTYIYKPAIAYIIILFHTLIVRYT